MTRAEEIARIARDTVHTTDEGTVFLCPGCRMCVRVAAAMELFAREERERCAKIAEEWPHRFLGGPSAWTRDIADRIAARIREGKAIKFL